MARSSSVRHDRLRDLDLHLIADAGLGIGPVVRHHEAAGRRGRHHGPRDLAAVTPLSPGPLAIDVDLDGRVVERLGELQIPQERRSFAVPGGPCRRYSRFSCRLPPAHGDLDRRGRAEAHDLADDVGGLEREPHAWGSRRAVPAAAAPSVASAADPAARLQGDRGDRPPPGPRDHW